MAMIQATDLTFTYPGSFDPVFSHISFRLDTSWRLGVVGRNGRGKTTLLRLLSGEYPCSGLQSPEMTACFPQPVPDPSGLRGSPADYAEREGLDIPVFLAVLRKMGFARTQFEKDLSELSTGQQKKVLLSASLCRPAHLYLWDEPLNYIDLDSRLQLEELLQSAAPTMLFVEHDRTFRDRIATRTVTLDERR